jgi:hypothetical protein
LFEPAGRIIFVYAFEQEPFVRSEDNPADESSGVTDLINDFAARFSVSISRGRDCFMLRIVELINGALAVGIQRDRHSNSVVWGGRRHLRDDRKSQRQTDREKY